MEFVIIGGDAAGMSAASRAKRHAPDLKVTVLEQTQDVSYSACGMPYNIAEPQQPIEDLVVRAADVFRSKQKIDLRLGHTATAIDPAARLVRAATPHGLAAKIPYDRLLIATGARPLLPEIPGIDQPGIFALKSLADGRRIKDYLETQSVAKVVIIGMGYIALEMTEALIQRGIKVDLIKPRPRLLPWMPEEMAATVQASCEAAGAHFFTGNSIQRIERTGDHLMLLGDGIMLRADMVLAATGITPNSELAVEAGLDLGPNGAIAVNHRLQTSDPDIYAAGDCALDSPGPARQPGRLGRGRQCVWRPHRTSRHRGHGGVSGAGPGGRPNGPLLDGSPGSRVQTGERDDQEPLPGPRS
ncbi:MAG: FAD-dependent oxidoreductase [Desulfosarcinaceae bacterium]